MSTDGEAVHQQEKPDRESENGLSKEQLAQAQTLKDAGNQAFTLKDYKTAIDFFTQAINIDNSNAKYYLNRALSYAGLGEWKFSALDARKAVQLDPKYAKAHFRLVKALLELNMFRDARIALLIAFKESGDNAEFKALEETIFEATGVSVRPRSSDFEIEGELGDGNFSKIFKVYHKVTNGKFACKTIERATIDRMKRRHPNIHNEILMEKRVLQKLDHPGVVTLYSTFQDYGTLYYLMEYVEGGDLWATLHDRQRDLVAGGDKEILTEQVGLHWSLIRPYFADILNAVEHMHKHGIVHRDIKPENIMICANGHLKFVDFGTAKDLATTDLNGPDFVGTAEYMSPSTVQPKKSDKIGIDADLWALGVLLYQMVIGVTPFAAASPYLTFLRIKRAKVTLPSWVPAPVSDVIRGLLRRAPAERIAWACGLTSDEAYQASALSTFSYDVIRSLPFFTKKWDSCDPERRTESTVEDVRDSYSHPAQRVPTLRDLCIRATGKAAVTLALAIANAGGVRPASVPWMKNFDPQRLPAADRHRIMHFLERKKQLQSSGVFRLFHATLPDARCLRASVEWNEVVGMGRDVQGDWTQPFHFVQLPSPRLASGNALATQVASLKTALSQVNKLRPKVCVVMGDLTAHTPEACEYSEEVVSCRNTLARIAESIHMVIVPGPTDVGLMPHVGGLNVEAYRSLFGADFYGFWCGGLRGLVVNSTLLLYPHLDPQAAQRQESWLEEEVEQCKLCAGSVALFSYHPWFLQHADEEDTYWDEARTLRRTVPREVRKMWLQRLRHHKVRFVFSSGQTEGGRPRRPFPRALRPPAPPASDDDPETSAPATDDTAPSDGEDEVEEKGKDGNQDEEEGFANEDNDCEGPEQLGEPAVAALRVVHVMEDGMAQRELDRAALPATPAAVLALFA